MEEGTTKSTVSGNGTITVSVVNDISALPVSQEAEWARLREELARMDRAPLLGLLSVALAHELNQPLTAVRCNARAGLELLKRQTQPDEVSLLIKDLLDDIMSANERAASIILHMRTIFEGNAPPADDICPDAIIREVTGLLKTEAKRHSILFIVDVPPGLPPMKVGRIPIMQVLLNILDNAFDALTAFSPSSEPTVWVSAEQEHADQIQIRIRDNGPGISSDRLERIFDPLRSSKGHNMGMGLAICRSLLEAYGGSIRAENHPEGGMVFICGLPTMSPETSTSQR